MASRGSRSTGRPSTSSDTALLGALADALEELNGRPELRLIVLRGAGRAFSAGVDVGEHLGDELGPMLAAFRRAASRIVWSDVPTLAVAHGAVLGGACELVALTDLAIVADDATIGVPEIRLAVVPPVAAALFPRLIGAQRPLLHPGAVVEDDDVTDVLLNVGTP